MDKGKFFYKKVSNIAYKGGIFIVIDTAQKLSSRIIRVINSCIIFLPAFD